MIYMPYKQYTTCLRRKANQERIILIPVQMEGGGGKKREKKRIVLCQVTTFEFTFTAPKSWPDTSQCRVPYLGGISDG